MPKTHFTYNCFLQITYKICMWLLILLKQHRILLKLQKLIRLFACRKSDCKWMQTKNMNAVGLSRWVTRQWTLRAKPPKKRNDREHNLNALYQPKKSVRSECSFTHSTLISSLKNGANEFALTCCDVNCSLFLPTKYRWTRNDKVIIAEKPQNYHKTLSK